MTENQGLRFTSWAAPSKIRIEDGRLFYEFRHPLRLVTWGPGLLQEFVDIADISRGDLAESIQAYAHRWGVLELCSRHGWPISHPNFADAQWPAGSYQYCSEGDPSQSSEPLESWRFWSRAARALLRATAVSNQKGAGRPEDWIFLLPGLPARILEIEEEYRKANAPAAREIEDSLREQGWVSIRTAGNRVRKTNRQPVPRLRDVIAANEVLAGEALSLSGGDRWKRIALALNHWLTLGHPQQFCTAKGGSLRRTMAAGSDREHGWLFAALAAELLLVIPERWGVFLCISCGAVVIPKRRPSRGRRYCERCGIRAAWRDAQRRVRASR